MGRPVEYYAELLRPYGFELVRTEFIDIHASYLMAGAIRKGLNPTSRQEGEPLNAFSLELQQLLLPLTKRIDRV